MNPRIKGKEVNQLIRNLEIQAGMQYRLDANSAKCVGNAATFRELYVYDNFDTQKFAQLILQEGFDVVIQDSRFPLKGVLHAGKLVALEHFGIKLIKL